MEHESKRLVLHTEANGKRFSVVELRVSLREALPRLLAGKLPHRYAVRECAVTPGRASSPWVVVSLHQTSAGARAKMEVLVRNELFITWRDNQ